VIEGRRRRSRFSVLGARFVFTFWGSSVFMAVALPAFAQAPALVNGTVQSRAATQTVEQEIASIASREAGPAWVGYAVPSASRNRDTGCWSPDGTPGRIVTGPVRLEGTDTLVVLYRLEARRVGRIRVASQDCTFDTGGLTLHWLTGVREIDSINWLTALATGDASNRLINTATMALALHGDEQATERLIQIARGHKRGDARGTALFWLAQRASDRAAPAIAEALDDPETEVRKRAVFAMTMLPRDESVTKLIDLARSHRDTTVRRQAMFWLGQSRDPRALAFFEQVLR
jgi:hypothetical protein